MSEKTLQPNEEQNESRRLVAHFPQFMQAEGETSQFLLGDRVKSPERHRVWGLPFIRGTCVSLQVGETARVGDCVVKVTGFAANGDIHIDLYADSQARAAAR